MGFGEQRTALGFVSYNEYLASEHWTAFKKAYYASDSPRTCQVCGTRGVQLHHWTYARLGQELLSDVVPLCRKHHEEVHRVLKEKGWSVGRTADVVSLLTGQPVKPQVKKSKKQRQGEGRKKRKTQPKTLKPIIAPVARESVVLPQPVREDNPAEILAKLSILGIPLDGGVHLSKPPSSSINTKRLIKERDKLLRKQQRRADRKAKARGGGDNMDADDRTKQLQALDQSLAVMADTFPAHWKRMHTNLLAAGFNEEHAFRILLTVINGLSGGKLAV